MMLDLVTDTLPPLLHTFAVHEKLVGIYSEENRVDLVTQPAFFHKRLFL